MNFLNSFITALKPRFDDDAVDRLNYYYTTLVILILSITISAKQYVGAPIQCWVPAQFTGAWEQYAENFCFVQNTYWLPLDEYIPKDHDDRRHRELGYYQWVPFILAIEAMMFYVPCVLWRLLNWQSGINVQSAATMAADTANINLEGRIKVVKTVTRHIEDALDMQKDFGRHVKAFEYVAHCGKTRGAYVTILYLTVKFLYVVNVIGQFFLLNAFIGSRYSFWGAQILSDLVNGREWEDSGHFPRVTMCDFEVRVLGNVHRHTIQCVLMINMFNEKIFVFLWWWFLIVAVCTLLNLFYWLSLVLSESKEVQFVTKYLRVAGVIQGDNKRDEYKAVQQFVTAGLRRDGVFMLRIIANNAGDLIATEIAEEMWLTYQEKLRTEALSVEKSAVLPGKLPSNDQHWEVEGLIPSGDNPPPFTERIYPAVKKSPPNEGSEATKRPKGEQLEKYFEA